MDNEPSLTWNTEMHSLIQEMIRYRKGIPDSAPVNDSEVAAFESRYDAILDTAQKEYAANPPSKYYKDGYNLAARLKEYKAEQMLFLHDHRVPTTNNLAERLLRQFKRKQTQVMSFRSFQSIEDLCSGMSMLASLRLNGEENIFSKVCEIFDLGISKSPVAPDY